MSETYYVYTAKGEARAKEVGLNRKEGEIAMCGRKPVFGLRAKAWMEKGYIIEVKKDGK